LVDVESETCNSQAI